MNTGWLILQTNLLVCFNSKNDLSSKTPPVITQCYIKRARTINLIKCNFADQQVAPTNILYT